MAIARPVELQDFVGDGYDFACIFDALHDMGDPVGAAKHIREALGPDGTLMLVEPLAGEQVTAPTPGQLSLAAGVVKFTTAEH